MRMKREEEEEMYKKWKDGDKILERGCKIRRENECIKNYCVLRKGVWIHVTTLHSPTNMPSP